MRRNSSGSRLSNLVRTDHHTSSDNLTSAKIPTRSRSFTDLLSAGGGAIYSKLTKSISNEEINQLKGMYPSFTEKEIRLWHGYFKKAGATNDELSKVQFRKIFEDLLVGTWFKASPKGNNDAFYLFVFRAFDRNNNGTVTFLEFLNAMEICCSGFVKRQLDWFFRMYDAKNSGTLEVGEIARIVKSIYQMRGLTGKEAINSARTAFAVMDKDNDGKITKSEFYRCCLNDRKLFLLLTNQCAK